MRTNIKKWARKQETPPKIGLDEIKWSIQRLGDWNRLKQIKARMKWGKIRGTRNRSVHSRQISDWDNSSMWICEQVREISPRIFINPSSNTVPVLQSLIRQWTEMMSSYHHIAPRLGQIQNEIPWSFHKHIHTHTLTNVITKPTLWNNRRESYEETTCDHRLQFKW